MSSEIFELKKQQYLQARGHFCDRFAKEKSIVDLSSEPDGSAEIKTAGRVINIRMMGKALFANLYDFTGTIQIYLRRSSDSDTLFEDFNKTVSIGDFVGVEGEMFTTRTGERTLNVRSFSLLNKCIRTMPEKFHGIENVETRYRRRYLDVIANQRTREVFQQRMAIVRAIRNFLEKQGFMEVETPILQTIPSGAMAKPFQTHHNALDLTCTLRIAPETWLKRLIGAGFDKVFEFAKCFRNEGISPAHLQEFTMLEFYAAYWNWEDQREFCTQLFREVLCTVYGRQILMIRGQEIDVSGAWPTYTLGELIQQYTGLDIFAHKTESSLVLEVKRLQILVEDLEVLSWANVVDAVYKTYCRPQLTQPCFVTQYPAEMAPLARRNKHDPSFVDLFQLVIDGIELIKAYSELVDPLEQRVRLEEQASARDRGDQEAMPMDEDFLIAMEHGFPPIAGVGIGIDRLVSLLCARDNIKESVFFPLMKPE